MKSKLKRYICLCGFAIISSLSASAQQSDSNQLLLDLLVKKGILTQDEASQFNQLVKSKALAQSANTSEKTVAVKSDTASPSQATITQVNTSPLSFKIGIAEFSPVGFLDFTAVSRSTSSNGAIGSAFNSIPFSNTSSAQLREFKFSAQNSRLGLKIDSKVDDTKVLGYLETDFLGNAASTLNVSSNAATLRLRVYFADLKKGDWEIMAGQDWSLLTPNRRGISPMPSDIFYSMDIDTNYQAGLTWARQPQLRLTYHATKELTYAISAENPDNYTSGATTNPAGIPTSITSEIDANNNTPNAPSPAPDFIGKIAYDTTELTGLPFHIEVAGLHSNFAINTYGPNLNATSNASGNGAAASINFDIFKGLTFISTGFTSSGGGRYIQGMAPDFIVTNPDSSGAYGIKTVKSSSMITGLEYVINPSETIYGYYSSINIGNAQTISTTGVITGYGYTGSANSNNKNISEYTLGNTYTFWKSPTMGALQLMGQVSYVTRTPWYVAAGTPTNAKTTMIFANLRYLLP
jgi:polyhydroxyalkanoate synthesis regulator phasin